MPKTVLTDISIRALKPPAKGQVTHFHTSLSGFGVRVSQGGTKTYTVIYGANRRRVSLGKYGTISLSKARKEAKRILAEHTLGKTKRVTINLGMSRRLLKFVEQALLVKQATQPWRSVQGQG